MRTRRKSYCFLIIFLVTVLWLPNCRKKETKQIYINVGYVPIVGDLPIFVAYEKGFFTKEGLGVKLIEFQSGNEAMNALLTNRIVMEATIGSSTLFSIEEKSPGKFKVILSSDETDKDFGSYILVRKDQNINSLEQLKGKRIGTYTGLTHLLNLKMILRNVMDPDKDIEIVQIEPRLQIQAMQAKQFEALFSIEPYPSMALQMGIATVLVKNARSKYIVSPYWAAGTQVSSKIVAERPEIVKKLIKAVNSAVDFIQTKPEEARKIIPKYTPISLDLAMKVNLYQWTKLGNENRKIIQILADKFFDAGFLKSKININNIFLDLNKLK